jgi:hypothetical protein
MMGDSRSSFQKSSQTPSHDCAISINGTFVMDAYMLFLMTTKNRSIYKIAMDNMYTHFLLSN